MHHPVRVLVLLISAGALLASCSAIIDNRGHSPEDTDFKQIVPGQSREDDVRVLLGTPSARSMYGDEIWYYITERKETVGMFPTEVVDQHVTEIHFDKDHTVTTISEADPKDIENVELVEKTSPTEGHNLTFMEQMLGNFGRFNAPGRTIDPRDLGR